jgi:hypothetical protein
MGVTIKTKPLYLAEAYSFATDSNATGAAPVNSGERSPRRPGDRALALLTFCPCLYYEALLLSPSAPKCTRASRVLLENESDNSVTLSHHRVAVNP